LMSVAAGIVLAGCASLSGNEIHVSESEKTNPNAVKVKSLASVRIAGYTDGRNMGNPRKIGVSEARVLGLSGPELILDRDVTDVVTASLRKRLDDAGIQVLAKDDASALFELSGVVKELQYDVKARDKILIKLETALKEVATGKVVWAGEVEQKNDRFAGVSGNSKGDIADYLKQEVGVATSKTADAVNSVLMATRPELFNLTPGTKVIPGVKVLTAPGATAPVQAVPAPAMPAEAAAQPQAPSANALLVVNTEPARAKVYLDGVYYGMSPLRAEAAPGVHKVEVKLKGYKTASEKVSLRKGDSTELELTLER
jgi:PEGA domain